jgi:hypothetical protein
MALNLATIIVAKLGFNVVSTDMDSIMFGLQGLVMDNGKPLVASGHNRILP